MAWTYGGVRIFPQEMSDTRGQIIPRLQPLASGTILQFFGYEEEIKKLVSLIVGSGDKLSLEAMMITGLSYELISPAGSMGDYFPKSMSINQNMTVIQTIRPDLDCYAPLYRVEMELYKDTM